MRPDNDRELDESRGGAHFKAEQINGQQNGPSDGAVRTCTVAVATDSSSVREQQDRRWRSCLSFLSHRVSLRAASPGREVDYRFFLSIASKSARSGRNVRAVSIKRRRGA